MKLQGRNKISTLVLYKEQDEDVTPIINTTGPSHLFLSLPLKSPGWREVEFRVARAKGCAPNHSLLREGTRGENVSPVFSGSHGQYFLLTCAGHTPFRPWGINTRVFFREGSEPVSSKREAAWTVEVARGWGSVWLWWGFWRAGHTCTQEG